MTSDDNILIRYLDGELSIVEKDELEKELELNSDLKDELIRLRTTREAVKLFGLQQKVGNLHGEMMNELRPATRSIGSARKRIRYAVAIAASIILVVGIYMVYNFVTLSSEKVYNANYQAYELANMRGESITETPMEKAFRQKQYKQVLALHKKNTSETTKEKFLSGVSAMELDNNAQAINFFKSVKAENELTGKNDFGDEADYFLALTYIRNKDYDYALELLKTIKDDPAHLYNKKVTNKLLRQVRMLKWR
jgi:hypothetical protein